MPTIKLCVVLAILAGANARAQAPSLVPAGTKVRIRLADSTGRATRAAVVGGFAGFSGDTVLVSVNGDSLARISSARIASLAVQARRRSRYFKSAAVGAFAGYAVGFVVSTKHRYTNRCDAFGTCRPPATRLQPFIGSAIGALLGFGIARLLPPPWENLDLRLLLIR
jgi:hypothetical protein